MRAGLAGDGVVGWGGNRFAIPTLLGDFGLFIYLFLPIFHLRPAERDMPLRPPEWIMAWA